MDENINRLEKDLTRDIETMKGQVGELNKRFEEKIRRQNLIQNTKKLSPNASDEELFKQMKQRPKFMAQHMTRELVLNGRLP